MTKKIFCILLGLLLACAPAFKSHRNPYLQAIDHYGPLRETVWQDRPPSPEILIFGHTPRAIEYPMSLSFFYQPSEKIEGDLSISDMYLCKAQDEFCLEFLVDGLTGFDNRIRFRIDILQQNEDKQHCIFTTGVPIESGQGYRAVHITAWGLMKHFEEADFFVIQVTDFWIGKIKQGIIERSD